MASLKRTPNPIYLLGLLCIVLREVIMEDHTGLSNFVIDLENKMEDTL
jgi:hypothetical protein